MQQQNVIPDEVKVIVFRLGNEEYGVEVAQVRSIERMQQITRVPRTPSFVVGVMNLRGVVIPVIDLKRRFELEAANLTDSTRIIIVAYEDMEVGLIVDAANDVVDLPVQAIEPPPVAVGGVQAMFLRGVAKLADRLLIMMNLDKVLSQEELLQASEPDGGDIHVR